MQIDSNSWHCKLYKWWYSHKYPTKNTILGWDKEDNPIYEFIQPKTNSNLCPYMRAVLLWAPIRALFWSWISVWKIPLNVFTFLSIFAALPLLVHGEVRHKVLLLYITFVLALVIFSSVVFILYLLFYEKILNPVFQSLSSLFSKVEQYSFFSLLCEYLRSAHDRVCPEVSWKNLEKKNK